MSSKSAGAKAGKEVLFQLLHLIATGSCADIPPLKIQYLKRHGYLMPTRGTYMLAPKGRRALSETRIWSLSIPRQKTWDKKWHLVLFDIPVDKRKRRDSFRLRLKELGLTKYQHSVWIHPYPLKQVVGQIADFYRISSFVSFVTAECLSGETRLRKTFGLGL